MAGGINLYEYVGGDPVNAVDPWGLSSDQNSNYFDAAFTPGVAMAEINDFSGARSHYRSGAGGTVPAGWSLNREMQAHASFKNRIDGNGGEADLVRRILNNHLERAGSSASGTYSNIPGSSVGQLSCPTLGSYGMNVTYQLGYRVSTRASGNHVVHFRIEAQYSLVEEWDFASVQGYNAYQNITREHGPGFVAGLGFPQSKNFTIVSPEPISRTYQVSVPFSRLKQK
jgi:uncharacterized protein RhaS with RHS repeats